MRAVGNVTQDHPYHGRNQHRHDEHPCWPPVPVPDLAPVTAHRVFRGHRPNRSSREPPDRHCTECKFWKVSTAKHARPGFVLGDIAVS